jgi:hypothetical protein
MSSHFPGYLALSHGVVLLLLVNTSPKICTDDGNVYPQVGCTIHSTAIFRFCGSVP